MTTQDNNQCGQGDGCQPDKHLLAFGNANVRKLAEQARIARLDLLHRLSGSFERREYYLTGALTMDAARNLTAVIDQWCRIDGASPDGNRKVRVILNSADGDMVPALAIYDYLRLVRLRGFQVTIEVAGHASYHASLIVAAASPGCRVSGPHSYMMISQLKKEFSANSLDAEHRIRWLVQLQDQYNRLVSQHTGMEPSEFAEYIAGNKVWCLNAKEMKRWGFIDDVIEPRAADPVMCLINAPFFEADDSLDLMAQKAETARNAAQAQMLHLDALAQETVDEEYRTHRLFGPVTTESCTAALQSLRRFATRCESGKGSTLMICSPGGSIVDGIGVVGQMAQMEASGHPVQTVGIGYMASMGGVLLAAGATNLIGEESWVLVHRAAGWFGGTTEEIVDSMKRLERLQNEECFTILASRKRRWPKSSRKRGIDVKEIKKRCDRGDWWVPARVAKRLGLVDEVF